MVLTFVLDSKNEVPDISFFKLYIYGHFSNLFHCADL